MGKILDYVRWRGDLTLDREPFNSLDAGLFAAFAYLPFDSSVKGHTLEAATKRLIQKKTLIHSDKLEAELVNLSDAIKICIFSIGHTFLRKSHPSSSLQ